jgi:hypothetical protein
MYIPDNNERLPLCRNWGKAWASDHPLRSDKVCMPKLLEPYIGKNPGTTDFENRTKARSLHSVFACPTGVKVKDSDVGWTDGADRAWGYGYRELVARNDYVTYVWNHIYLNVARNSYEIKRPVSGRQASDVVKPQHRCVDLGDAILGLELHVTQARHCAYLPRWSLGSHAGQSEGARLVGLP